ncbi:MAG: diacylglycerol kinase family protein [Chitinophagaceae bacterium]
MEKQKFSVNARVKSFGYAFRGIGSFVQSEHNAWVHLAATFTAIAVSIWLRISKTEFIAIIGVIGFVWVTEILNTCIEKMMDFISTQQHPQIKLIKDMAAGAVLVAAITALVTGLIIFIPKIIYLT